MLRPNKRLPVPDLLLAQLLRRLDLAGQPVRNHEAEEALSEMFVYGIVLVMVVIVGLMLWVVDAP